MIDNIECIEHLDTIFEVVKFTANSFVRLKVLATLYERPRNMKEMTDVTGLSYSSVSSTMHDLEIKGWVYREHNKYFLTNSAGVRIGNVLEMDKTLLLLNEFFNILQGHIVDRVPYESILEFHVLQTATLMESSGVDAYRTFHFIENCLYDAEFVKCVIPIFYEPYFDILSNIISVGNDVEIYVPEKLLNSFERKSGIECLKPFDESTSFLLIITDKVMILGFFMDNGYFDQTRILTSNNEDSLIWANNLFKSLNINEF